MTQTFLKKDGNIREVLKTMLDSPEFWAPDAYRAKVKTPLEFVVSAVRASGAEVTDAMPIAHQLQNMGMPLFGIAAANWLFHEGGRLGQLLRTFGPHEFCLGADLRKGERSASGFRTIAGPK